MSVKIISNDGEGLIRDEIFNYSYSEDAVSLNPLNSDGGIPQCSFSTIAIDSQDSSISPSFENDSTNYLINNSLVLNDSYRGNIYFKAKKLSKNNDLITVSGDSIQSLLNVDKTAIPFYARSATYGWDGLISLRYDDSGNIAKKNLFLGTDFQSSALSYWTYTASGNFIANPSYTYSGYVGSKVLRAYVTSGTASNVKITYFNSVAGTINVDRLKSQQYYTFNIYVKKATTFTGNDTITFSAFDYTNYSNSYINPDYYKVKTVKVTDTWQRVSLTFLSTEQELTNKSLMLTIDIPSLTAGQDIVFSAPQLIEGVFEEPYFNGSFSAGTDPIFNGTLTGAIKYYCSLCNVVADTSQITSDVTGLSFIGWEGNVWEYLKQLLSVYNIDCYIFNNQFYFKPAKSTTSNINFKNISSKSEEYSVLDAAQSVDVYNYNTSIKTNQIIYEISNYDKDADKSKVFLSSVSDSFQVDPGQTVTKTFEVDTYLTKINQPVCVSTISSIPYVGTTGEYVIVGNDDLEILPEQWIGEGGSLKVEIGDKANEVKITVTAPNTDSLISKNGETLTYGPYRIGVETSGDGTDYPALWITGTGVFYNKTSKTFLTGVNFYDVSKESEQNIDNIFIINDNLASSSGLIAAQSLCGPEIVYNFDLIGDINFGIEIGSTFIYQGKKFRIKSINYSENSISCSAEPISSFFDFTSQPNYSSETFSSFTNTVGYSFKFTSFATTPLLNYFD